MKKRLIRGVIPVTLLWMLAGITHAQIAGQGQHADLAPLPDGLAQQLLSASRVSGTTLSEELVDIMAPVPQLLADIQAQELGPGATGGGRRALLPGTLNQLARFSTQLKKQMSQANAQDLLASTQQRVARIVQALQAVQTAQGAGALSAALANANQLVDALFSSPQRQLSQVPLALSPNWKLQPGQQPLPQSASQANPAYHLAQLQNRPVLYAFLGSLLVAEAPATPAEASTCSYTAADLAETEEVQLTTEIRALAQSLKYSPVQIYQWVYDNIKFEPYYGSLKGATGTLYAKAGGATDQASLLIALLRASNIPARYVKGQVAVVDDSAQDNPSGRAARWLGAKSYAGAVSILAAGRNPTAQRYIINNVTRGISMVHVWAEACVPYGHYRGARVDATGTRWLALDASFKDRSYRAGITTGVSFDYGTTGTGYLAKRSNDLPQEVYARSVLAKAQTMAPNYANNSLVDVAAAWTQNPRRMDILPATLPYSVLSFLAWDRASGPAEVANLPDGHRYKYTVTAKDAGGAQLATATLSMPANILSRVTLSYQGLDAAHQKALTTWQAGNAVPPATIKVVPVIKVEGANVAVVGTTAVALNTQTNGLVMAITLGDLGQQPLTTCSSAAINCITYNNIGAANYHALQAYGFQASDRLLAERAAKLTASVRATPSNPNANADAITGEFLHLVGLKYMRYVSDAAKRIGSLNGNSGDVGNSLGLASTQMRVKYLFDQPFEVTRDGYLIDVPGGQDRGRDLSSGYLSWNSFKLASYATSAYESYVWQENARLDAVSTVRGLQFAAESGIEILTINSDNKAAQLAKLRSNLATTPGCKANGSNTPGYTAGANVNYAVEQITSIGTLVDQGKEITIPRCLIQYGNWNGAVYVAALNKIDADGTGEGSALFAINQYAGGYTTEALPSINYNGKSDSGFLICLASDYDSKTTPFLLGSGNVGPGNSPYNTMSGDPVNMVTGNMYHSETDLVIKGRGLPMVFSRAYNSRGIEDGPLGYGWTHSFNHYLRFNDDNLSGAAGGASTDGKTSSVTWVDGSGAQKGIKVVGKAAGVDIGAVFTPPLGNYFTMTRGADGYYRITEQDGTVYTFENVSGVVGKRAKLLSIVDRNGNTLNLSYTAGGLLDNVSDGVHAERKLSFSYGGTHITQISDWSGRFWQYGYDANGNLSSYKTPLAVQGLQPAKNYTYIVDTSVDSAGNVSPVNHAMRSVVAQNGYTMTFEYYLNGKVFRHTNSSGYASTFSYNDFRRESVHVDERGNTRHFFFDPSGNPVRTIEADGSELNYSYYTGTTGADNPYLRKTATNAAGNLTRYAYDGYGNVTTVTLPDNNTVVSSYFSFGQPGKIKDARGNYSIRKFDAKGNVLQSMAFKVGVGAAVDPTTYVPVAADLMAWSVRSYDSYGNPATDTRIRDFAAQTSNPGAQNGPRLTYNWDDTVNGVVGLNLIAITRMGDANGDGLIDAVDVQPVAVSSTYDKLGRALSSTQGAYTSVFFYDVLDRVWQSVDALSRVRTNYFDDMGNLTRRTLSDSSGVVSQAEYRYDFAGRRLEQSDTAGNVSLTGYDASGNLVSSTNADNYSVTLAYDAMDRAIKAFDAKGNAATTAYDTLGRQVALTDPNGVTVTKVYYDASKNGRLKQSVDALGRTITYDYDPNGNVTSVTDNAGRVSRTAYDALNRPTRMVGPQYTDAVLGVVSPVTTFVYDNLGNRIQVLAGHSNGATDTLKLQRTEIYNDFGRKLSSKDALNRVTRYSYDSYGNLNKLIDAKTQVTNFTYEYGFRLKTVTDNAARVTTYTYNALDQPLTVAAPGVRYSYAYDSANRLKSVTDSRASKALNYTYSPGGKLLITQDSDANRTDYLYDSIGRLIGVWAPNLDYVSFGWDAGGRMMEKWLSNGVNSQYVYNIDSTLAKLKNRVGYSDANIISQHDYGYNALALRETQVERIGAVTKNYTYGYDELARLTSVKNSSTGEVLEAYSYDPLHNRRSKTDSAAAVLAYVYDDANQLLEVRRATTTGTLLASLGYDANGNMTTTASGWTLDYDAANRLTSASKAGQPSQVYAYDHIGRRISKTVGATTTNYLLNGADIASEYASTWGAAQAVYTHGGGVDSPLLRAAGGVTSYYHQDGLGSVVATSNSAGVTTGTQRFDAYGNKGAVTGVGIAQYGYTGREPDETGLSFTRARYYDPAVGRFTQRDPIGLSGGINVYAYVGGNPVNFTDPSGTKSLGSTYGGAKNYYANAIYVAESGAITSDAPHGRLTLSSPDTNYCAGCSSSGSTTGTEFDSLSSKNSSYRNSIVSDSGAPVLGSGQTPSTPGFLLPAPVGPAPSDWRSSLTPKGQLPLFTENGTPAAKTVFGLMADAVNSGDVNVNTVYGAVNAITGAVNIPIGINGVTVNFGGSPFGSNNPAQLVTPGVTIPFETPLGSANTKITGGANNASFEFNLQFGK